MEVSLGGTISLDGLLEVGDRVNDSDMWEGGAEQVNER